MDEHYMRCQKAFAAALSMIVAHSEELFGQAKENYEKEGRGCLYIEFSSVEKMEAADFNGYVGGYLSQYKAKKRKYDVLDTSIVKYDPNNQFVLCLACADSSGRWMYKASALPRNAHEFVDKMAQKQQQQQQQQVQNQQEQVAKCAVCAKTTSDLKRCSRCQQVYYCGRGCQVKDWPIHKAACGPARPVQQQQ